MARVKKRNIIGEEHQQWLGLSLERLLKFEAPVIQPAAPNYLEYLR